MRTASRVSLLVVVAGATGAAFLLPRSAPVSAADRDAAWAARACTVARGVKAERSPAATRALSFDLRHAADGTELRAVTLAHLDALDRRLAPLLTLLDQPELPAPVAARRPAIVKARDQRAAARASVASADPTAETIESVSSDGLYESEEAEDELLLIACPPPTT